MLERHDVDRNGAFAGVVLVSAPAWMPPGYDSLAEFFAEPFDWALLRRAARQYRLLTAADDPVLMPQPVDHVKDLSPASARQPSSLPPGRTSARHPTTT